MLPKWKNQNEEISGVSNIDCSTNRVLSARFRTCAWHDALTELPVLTGSHKTPTVTGRKGNANKARAVSRNGASEGSMRQNLCT